LLRNHINSDAMNGTRSNLNFDGLHGVMMFTLSILSLILSLVGCSHQARLRPDVAYRDARAKFERGELKEAFEAAESGAQRYAKRDLSRAYQFRVLAAEILVWQGKSKDALALLSEDLPRALENDEIAVRKKLVEGTADFFLQHFDESSQRLTEANILASEHHPDLLGDVAMAQGTLSVMRNNLQEAYAHYHAALEIANRLDRPFVQANAIGNLGFLALNQQHYSESIEWSNAGIPVARRLQNKTLEEKFLGNLGWCYYKLGDFERALSNTTESEATAEQNGLLKDQLLWLTNLGLISYQNRDFEKADAYYNKALAIARRVENRSLAAVCLTNLASTALETKRYDLAEKYNVEALELKRSTEDKVSELYSVLNQGMIAAGRKQYPEATTLLEEVIHDSGDDVSLRWEAESNLAGVYAIQSKIALADAQYRKALSTIDSARAALSKEEHRLSFLTTATRFYNDYIDFLVSHGRSREALAVAEHSRARTLSEGLKVPVSQLGGAAFHPEQNARKLNSVVLSYWLKPERSYLWVVTPTKVALFPLAGQDEIDSAAQEYRKALLGPRPETASAPGQKLYELLVAPAQKLLPSPASPCPTSAAISRCGKTTSQDAPRVIVIGDGSLLSLNFETLLVPTPQPHYWIEDATIANASSIALLGVKTSPPSRDAGRVGHPRDQKLLLIGDPTYAGSEYPQLTQAKLEVQRVESYFPEQSRVVIQGKNATPGAYAVTKPFQYNFIHFVAHGTASRVSPLDSSIVLSKEGDAYKLYARDIMTQPLKAQLVTISACYGAGNRAYSGEGLVGLSWAFLRAGAHNVIAALWEVNDASTPQLMGNLYLNVRNGQDPATALRAAKLAMLHSENVFRRPFYWGAFQLYIGS